MALRVSRLAVGIAARLYCVAVLSVAAVGVLAWTSIHFAEVTAEAAGHLHGDGFVGVQRAARLELVLEVHRRVVESAPAEQDRDRLLSSQQTMEDVTGRLEELVRNSADEHDAATASFVARISENLPDLVERGRTVFDLTRKGLQNTALAFAQQDYARSADRIQSEIQAYRDQRLKIADREVALLAASSRDLILWVTASALAAVVLIGPFGLTIMHRVLSRLKRITSVMRRLARNDTGVDVPSRQDRDEVGQMARAVQVFKANALALLRREADLRDTNRRFDTALNNMSHGLCMFDREQNLIVCNSRYAEIYGLPPELTECGTSLRRILEHRVASGAYAGSDPDAYIAERLQVVARARLSASLLELGDGRTIAVSHRPTEDGGWVSVHEDVTDRRRAEERIAHMAQHDALTDLPNRLLFRERMEQALTRVRRGERLAVLCLDLDRFKDINDTLGHPVGDALLKAVADRLRGCMRDIDTVARLGGDEFAVIQTGLERPEDAGALARRIVDVVSAPYDLDQHQVVVGTSIGVALAPNDGTDPDQLLKSADMALYRAKADGRGTFRYFEPEMDARLQTRRSLEVDLRKALATGEFELYYQPLVNLRTDRISGFEALLRWAHPQRGMVSPGEFIPLAEEIGLIVPLGEWVIRRACAEAMTWPGDIKIAVNLSPVQFKSRGLVQAVVSALAATGLAPDRLELEITESVLLQDNDATLAILQQLKALGVRISMDDFGTGYSSLSYLRSFPFDKIKIDQSFIRDLSDSDDSLAIVRAVAGLGSSFGIATTAEGVETAAQLEKLRAEGCTEVQGYFFSPPRPAAEIAQLLTRHGNRLTDAA